MKIFLSILILIFSQQSWTKADDISDFQIQGISLGDSVLNYYTEKQILTWKLPSKEQVDEAVSSAREVFERGLWHQKPMREKAQVLDEVEHRVLRAE